MKILSWLYPAWPSARVSLGLLFLRVVSGLAMMQHGWSKIQSPTSWMGPDSPVPGWAQACAALGEFGGGLGLLVGAFTPLAALGIASTMIGAILIAHRDAPWIAGGKGPSWEAAGFYLFVAITFLLAGPGLYALDALWVRGRSIDPERIRRV